MTGEQKGAAAIGSSAAEMTAHDAGPDIGLDTIDRAGQGAKPDGINATVGRILIVEDESNILEAISFILGRAGWDVRGHGKGGDALEEIARLSPDMLVLDVMLPGRSGFEILADLRARPETRDLPVLMLTAKGQAKDRDQAMALGANGFLTKPFANTELLDVITGMRKSVVHSEG
ncbi:response regulator [Gymnodinialimonas sp. 57CJ19]|uniref:response regulator transcription factor n=1 Tax=Gymnodinialimonas sp. 57CJ19 TaxID=3138498 RepID=UPI0031345846